MTDSPVSRNTAPKTKAKGKNAKVLLIVLGIIALLFIALLIGLFIGYQFITKTPGSNIFRWEIWRRFFEQIRSLR